MRQTLQRHANIIAGVYRLPQILTTVQINTLLKLKELRCHHDDEGHSKDNLNRFRADKPHQLPCVASLIWQHIPDIRIDTMRPYGVDENMQLYRLQEGAGVVPKHRDEDFDGPNRSIALYSILLYLNDEYTGGETVFNGTIPAPHVAVGGGLLFKHDIPHEGLMVLSGEKYVLKTDLFFSHK